MRFLIDECFSPERARRALAKGCGLAASGIGHSMTGIGVRSQR
jgi:hypothetical protein